MNTILMPSPEFLKSNRDNAKAMRRLRLNTLIIDDYNYIPKPKHITRKKRLKQKKRYRRRMERYGVDVEYHTQGAQIHYSPAMDANDGLLPYVPQTESL